MTARQVLRDSDTAGVAATRHVAAIRADLRRAERTHGLQGGALLGAAWIAARDIAQAGGELTARRVVRAAVWAVVRCIEEPVGRGTAGGVTCHSVGVDIDLADHAGGCPDADPLAQLITDETRADDGYDPWCDPAHEAAQARAAAQVAMPETTRRRRAQREAAAREAGQMGFSGRGWAAAAGGLA